MINILRPSFSPSMGPPKNGGSAAPHWCILLFALLVQGCDPITGDEPGPATYDQSISDEMLGASLVYAIREVCVPYVVDGVSEASVTERPGITEFRYYIHGQRVTAYGLDQPGSPRVLLFDEGAPRRGCRVDLATLPSSDRLAIIDAFKHGLRFDGHSTSQPHDVDMPGVLRLDDEADEHSTRGGAFVCIHGSADALLQTSNPPQEYPLAIYLDSSPVLVASNACGPADETRQ